MVMEIYQLGMNPTEGAKRVAEAIETRKSYIESNESYQNRISTIIKKYESEGYVLVEHIARAVAVTEIALTDQLSIPFSELELNFRKDGYIKMSTLRSLANSDLVPDNLQESAKHLDDRLSAWRRVHS